MKIDDSLKEDILAEIGSIFNLKQCDVGKFNKFNYPRLLRVFKFGTEQYKGENLGNIAILKGSSLLGMSIFTVVITPKRGIDLPLLIIDYFVVKDKITVFVEFYGHFMKDQHRLEELAEICRDKISRYNNLEKYIEQESWYTTLRCSFSPLKKGNSGDAKMMKEMIIDYLKEYLQFAKSYGSNGIKNNELQDFINDLVIKGNPSSDILKKALGSEKSNEFFRKIIFYY